MRAYAVEQFDKKMMDDARIKSKMGQELGKSKASRSCDLYANALGVEPSPNLINTHRISQEISRN